MVGVRTAAVAASSRSPQTDADARSPRVLLLYADIGEGHLAMAQGLACELERDSGEFEVIRCNGLAGLGAPVRRLVRGGSRLQLGRSAWLYGAMYDAARRSGALRGLLARLMARASGRALLRVVSGHRPDIIVSTHPAVNPVLGRLRQRGRLAVPALTAVIDHADIPFWAHPGLDLHLVMLAESVKPVERVAGPGSARLVRPLVDPRFFVARPRAEARRALDLPIEGTVVIVSGGGWGVGDLAGSVRQVLTLPSTTVVCLCGRDEATRERLAVTFAPEQRVRVLGFSDRMDELLHAADAVVLASGGMTCLEALVCGCPVIAYGAPPGHAIANFRALAELGLVRVAERAQDLPLALHEALTGPPPALADGAARAAEILREWPAALPAPDDRGG